MGAVAHDPQFPAGHARRSGQVRWLHAFRAVPVLLALISSVALLVRPVHGGLVTGTDGTRQTVATLLEVNGPVTLVHLTVPVLLTGVIAVVRGPHAGAVSIGCAAVLAGLVMISLFSIGMFYVPAAAIAAVVAVMRFRATS
ncbi:hypothetical protein IM660_12690 [Ruania alkalisoli]|uniref:Uncharacterized protein n=1 Tax=Ruania alkalisoli TaxID=2779775 RepID=A0A7M1SRB9_9MICO|nr:hypothetical protein [Ruania alkalisoli]QOR69534.1 hypothetical protein IM660_12690 [Ruania alkalisoli]